jgi:hypothetical protein
MKFRYLILISIFIHTTLHLKAEALSDTLKNVPPQYKHSQSAQKGRFFFYWGYNRAAFLKSDIHFKGPHYDFTLLDVKAKDRPTAFSFETYFGPTTLSIPQYNYRIGYYLSPHWGISIGVDHMKYVVNHNQSVKMTGSVDTFASPKYAGNYNNQPVILTEDFLRYEHTDGLNLLSLDAEYVQPLAQMWQGRLRLAAQAGGGLGLVIPRTDSKVFGDGLNNKFHLAGWGINTKVGFKLDILKRFFIETQTRVGYINLSDILLHNEQPQRAKQNIVFGQVFVVAGVYF